MGDPAKLPLGSQVTGNLKGDPTMSLVGAGLCARPFSGMAILFRIQRVMEAENRSKSRGRFPSKKSGGHGEPPLPREQRSSHAKDWV